MVGGASTGLLRGWLHRALGPAVAPWGYADTSLSELAIRCSKCDAYEALRQSFPSATEKKLSYLRSILDTSGPLSRYRSIGLLYLDQFAATERSRHMMAHGRMKMVGPQWIEIEEINTEKRGSLKFRSQKLCITDLEKAARKATKLSRLIHRAVCEINKRGLLPSAT